MHKSRDFILQEAYLQEVGTASKAYFAIVIRKVSSCLGPALIKVRPFVSRLQKGSFFNYVYVIQEEVRR